MHEAEVRGALAQPVFIGDAGTVPDDTGVVDVEFLGEAVDAQEAEVRNVVDVGHDEETGDVGQLAAVFGLDAVGVEVVEEGLDDGVRLGDVHLLGVKFGHLGIVETGEVWPASLEDELVNVDWWRGGSIWVQPSLLVLVFSTHHARAHQFLVVPITIFQGSNGEIGPAATLGRLIKQFGEICTKTLGGLHNHAIGRRHLRSLNTWFRGKIVSNYTIPTQINFHDVTEYISHRSLISSPRLTSSTLRIRPVQGLLRSDPWDIRATTPSYHPRSLCNNAIYIRE